MNYETMTVEELIREKGTIDARIKELRTGAKATKLEEANTREAWARENVNEGDVITFMHGREVGGVRPLVEGKVVRTSEKSVTVEFELEEKVVNRYKKYSEIMIAE